jgi:hypothetical protein
MNYFLLLAKTQNLKKCKTKLKKNKVLVLGTKPQKIVKPISVLLLKENFIQCGKMNIK